jgi:pimeloyl-ACP methyl ester carboxylesterase
MIETIRIDDLTVLRARPAHATHAPVLFVHGYFAEGAVWREWLERFAARGIPAYAVNLRGRAGSGPTSRLGAVSIQQFADDVERVARHLGNAAIVGHSMGGLVTQVVAARGAARAAVLIAPAPPRGIVLFNPRLMMKQARYLPQVLLSRVLDPDLDDLRDLAMNCLPSDMQRAALAAMVADSGRAGRDMSIVGVPVDRAKVKCPLLVIGAEDDHFVPAAVVRRIARRYDAPLQMIPGHGHMVIIEPGWEAVADTITRWFAEHA